MIKIYGIKTCGSVKKALNFFNDNNLEYLFQDFKFHPVDRMKIQEWVDRATVDILLNTKGTTYKTLGLKAMNLNTDEKIMWMSQYNLLIKRPVIEYQSHLLIGFDESKYEGLFLS